MRPPTPSRWNKPASMIPRNTSIFHPTNIKRSVTWKKASSNNPSAITSSLGGDLPPSANTASPGSKRDFDGGGAPRGLSVINNFDVVAVRVQNKSRIISWMVGPLPRRSIVAPTMSQSSLIGLLHHPPTPSLKGQMVTPGQDTQGGRTVRR